MWTHRFIPAGALALVLISGCGAAGSPATSAPGPTSPSATPTATGTATATGSPIPVPGAAAALENAYVEVINRVLRSIVQINTSDGLGSGVVYDNDGHIVTNAHVVGNSKTFQVTLATGGSPRTARLVASFPLGDLAVIKVDNASGLAPATFGDSSKSKVGQIVLAMGNPLGFSGSVTNGIISATGRTITEPQEQGSPGATITNAIQTSAAINPGNSGGALVNLAGEVIGIPTLAATDPQLGGGAAEGIGFAIPSNTAKDVADQIIKNGQVVNTRRAALGVRVNTVVGRDNQPAGVGVFEAVPGGPAAKAGIRAGDIITAVNGTPTPTSQALLEVLATLKPGDRVKVDVRRPDGSATSVNVTLDELKEG
ncbi:trypsin-like peptidase domain-containing protein [Thermopolyspora sp. NPDC052614]|uniref:S1C family serine protease n=1 Tax=Thermopolyspora sp. NPDC052614 TaxID=3155682 RepID=UPI0034130545